MNSCSTLQYMEIENQPKLMINQFNLNNFVLTYNFYYHVIGTEVGVSFS